MNWIVVLVMLLVGTQAQARDKSKVKDKWSHESEISMVTIGGNSESKTSSAKQKTKYSREKDSATVTAAITEAESNSVTTARSSNGGLRYDHVINKKLGGFLGYSFYSDKFAGINQEDRSDLGVTYELSKNDTQEWSVELGYQNSSFDYVGDTTESVDLIRVATAYTKEINESVTAGFKAEYRDAFADADGTDIPLYFVDSEVMVAVVMSKILSLKLTYENKYQNFKEKTAAKKHTDTKFITALVAKF